jgi:hypothetical protein
MKKIVLFGNLFTIGLILLTLFSSGQKLKNPECVIWDASNSRYLVSSIATGNIQKINPDRTYSLFSAPGLKLKEPKGLTILNGFLYVAEPLQIKKLNLNTGALVDSIVVNTKDGYMYGLANNGTDLIFASDYSLGKVYAINPSTKFVDTIVKKGISSPNGLLYEGALNRLLIITFELNGDVYKYDFALDSLIMILPTSFDGLAGIATDGKGNYYISEWVDPMTTPIGIIHKWSGGFGNAPVTLKTGLAGPSQFYYNTLNDTIACPLFGADTVVFIPTNMDLIPPHVDTAYATSYTKIRVIYSEAVNSTATLTTGGRYSGIGLFTAAINSKRDTVTLTLSSALSPNIPKNLVITGVQDMVGNTMAGGQTFKVIYPGNGIEDNIAGLYELKIFPNPVIDKLNYQYTLANVSEISVRVLDIHGKTIYSNPNIVQKPGHYSNVIEMNTVPGLYILEVSFDGKSSHNLFEVVR